MNLEKIVEFIFSLVMLLFIAVFILFVLIVLSVVQQLTNLHLSQNWQIFIVVVSSTMFVHFLRSVIKNIDKKNQNI